MHLYNTALHLYNTLSKEKEIFTPLNSKNVRMYVCGPTVYDDAHLGNARPVVVFDVLFRVLQKLYPKVTYVRNITDVDDKINAAAKSSGVSISDITKRTTKAYHEDMHALLTLPPTHEPRATDHIREMITMIQSLLASGHSYEAEGHVLFRTKSFAEYGKLSRRTLDDMIAGARVEIAPYKEDAADFVLWKPSTENTPGWESPFGFGRPGWHIECSAMSRKYLGDMFDIHGGGIDLVFPHHENEIAQSCAASGYSIMATYWLHNGHLMVEGAKMSKSLGNFTTVRQLLSHASGEAIRLCLLMTHYRQPLDFRESTLAQAKSILDKYYLALLDIPWGAENKKEDSLKDTSDPATVFDHDVFEALLDDLNTPKALMHLHGILGQYHKTKNLDLLHRLKAAAKPLGLLQECPKTYLHGGLSDETLDEDERIEALLKKRTLAKAARDFKTADSIRDDLNSMGIIIEDSPTGTRWRRG